MFQSIVSPVFQATDASVIILPDGPLGFIPFDALLTSDEGLNFNTLGLFTQTTNN